MVIVSRNVFTKYDLFVKSFYRVALEKFDKWFSAKKKKTTENDYLFCTFFCWYVIKILMSLVIIVNQYEIGSLTRISIYHLLFTVQVILIITIPLLASLMRRYAI